MYKTLACFSTLAIMIFATQGMAATANSRTSAAVNTNRMQNPKATLSNDVSVVLNCTHLARKSLANNNRQQAARDIDQALRAANQLGTNRMVPLYTELDEYSVLGPIEASRSTAQSTSTRNNSSTPPNTNRPEALAVNGVSGEFTAVDLDSALARTHLEAAQQALAKDDFRLADQALKGVQDSVILVSVGSDLPLVRARDNLVLARMDARHGQYEKAHLDLRAACRALTAYESEGGLHANDAKTLCSNIQSYNQSILNSHANAPARIESWWNQTADWMTPVNGTGSSS